MPEGNRLMQDRSKYLSFPSQFSYSPVGNSAQRLLTNRCFHRSTVRELQAIFALLAAPSQPPPNHGTAIALKKPTEPRSLRRVHDAGVWHCDGEFEAQAYRGSLQRLIYPSRGTINPTGMLQMGKTSQTRTRNQGRD
jgi:hypothetical protein